MRRLSYISGTGAAEVCLDCRSALAGTAEGVRGREWGYSIGYRSIAAAARAARECSLSVTFLDLAVADELRRLADRDVFMATPGTLAIDGWTQRAYITAADPSSISRAHMAVKLTVVLLDGVWRKGHTVSFEPLTATQGDGDSLDLPYDLPHDLAAPSPRTRFDAGEWGETPLRLVFYGPCIDPSVRIDGNLYRVEAVVPEGGHLVVDPLASPNMGATSAFWRLIWTRTPHPWRPGARRCARSSTPTARPSTSSRRRGAAMASAAASTSSSPYRRVATRSSGTARSAST